MSQYKLTSNADEDLYRIFHYGIEEFGLQAAETYYDKLHIAFDKIAEHPLLYPISSDYKEYRVYTLLPDSIYYRVYPNMVEIVAIIGSQDKSVWV